MKLSFLSLLFFLSSTVVSAQISKILHQTFEIGEVAEIQLNLVGEYEIEKWAGNTILTETKIELYDASPGIFNHFVEVGRYDIEGEINETTAQLASKDTERQAIRTREGECFEIIKVKIFVPDTFDVVDNTRLIRQAEQEEEK